MVDTPQSMTTDLIKQQLEEGRRRASKEDEGRGPLYDKDRKFMGIVPASSQAIRGLIYGAWLAGVEGGSKHLIGFFDKHVTGKIADKLVKNTPQAPNRVAAVSKLGAAGITIGIAAAPFIGDIFSNTKKIKKERDVSAKKVRALLEEVTGKSGSTALMGVAETQNEVLYVQRKRFEADMQQNIKDDLVMMGTSTAPTALLSVGKNVDLKGLMKAATETEKASKGSGFMFSSAGIAGLAPQVGEMLNEDSKRQYKMGRQKYTAFEMIVNLDEQLRDVDFSDGNGTDSFTLPAKGGSKSLAGYIAEVFKQHQYDMEKINPEHATLRTALHSQLDEISKDIAEAIKRGDVAPLSLARLAGEGYVIRNRGRSLAKPSDVRTTLQKMSSSALNYLQVDSLEYYGESSFSRRDLKEALGSLDGDDRIVFASLVPDDILKEAGVSNEQIQQIRDTSAQVYERKLARIVTGLAGYDDQALSDLGLATEEIEQLREVAGHVKTKGEESIKEFRAKPTDPAGIERVVTNAVVNRVQGNKEYLGTLMRQGQQFIDAAPAEAEEVPQEEKAEELADKSTESVEVAEDAAPEADEVSDFEEKESFASKEEARRESSAEEELDVAV